MLKGTNIFLGSLDPRERIRYFLQTTAMVIVCVRLVYLDPKDGDGRFLWKLPGNTYHCENLNPHTTSAFLQ